MCAINIQPCHPAILAELQKFYYQAWLLLGQELGLGKN